MFKQKESAAMLSFQFDTRQSIEQVIKESTRFFQKEKIDETDNLNIILRELLLNAVTHGNKNDPEKTVICLIDTREAGIVKIVVQDRGEGFDFSDQKRKYLEQKELNRESGYGLLFAIADDILFEKNGSRIVVRYKIENREDEYFTITRVEDYIEIIPRDNLTALHAEELRKLLMEKFDLGLAKFNFNLSQVQDIDSICLAVLLSFGKMVKNRHPEHHLSISNAGSDMITLFSMIGIKEFYLLNAGDSSAVPPESKNDREYAN